MFIPALVEPTFTDEQTSSVVASASGMAAISFLSASVIPFCTSAEKPPMKFTPVDFAAASSAAAKGT